LPLSLGGPNILCREKMESVAPRDVLRAFLS
jgi:hypothetical protein